MEAFFEDPYINTLDGGLVAEVCNETPPGVHKGLRKVFERSSKGPQKVLERSPKGSQKVL